MLAEIKSLLGLAEKTNTKLDALAASQTEAADLRAKVASLTVERDTALASVAEAKAALESEKATHVADVAKQATEIAGLKAAVETEKKRANDVIAAQGLAPEKLPPLSPESHSAAAPAKSADGKTNYTELAIAANRKPLVSK